MATQTAAIAAPFIYDSGLEVLPIGGFTGTLPEPSLAALKAAISRSDFRLVIQSTTVTDPRLTWIAQHCLIVKTGKNGSPTGVHLATYYCAVPDTAPQPRGRPSPGTH
jgi:hypothetical protein